MSKRTLNIETRINIAETELDRCLVPLEQLSLRLVAERAVLARCSIPDRNGTLDGVRKVTEETIQKIEAEMEVFQVRADAHQAMLDGLNAELAAEIEANPEAVIH